MQNDRLTTPESSSNLLIRHIIGVLFCIGLPALVTAIAPVSWVKFQRTGDQVTASANTCLLFIVPFRTVTVESVTNVGSRSVTGSTRLAERGTGGRHDKYVKAEDEGFLVMEGPAQTAEVPVTPHNLKSVIERSKAFLEDKSGTELKLFVVANWKFSVIAGGLVSLLTVLYIGGAFVALIKFLVGAKKPA